MSISVRDLRRSRTDRLWLESVYGDYLDDLAPLGTGVFPTLPEFGHRAHDQLTSWYADSSAHLLTILKDDAPVGFAVVRTGHVIAGRGAVDYLHGRILHRARRGAGAASGRKRCA